MCFVVELLNETGKQSLVSRHDISDETLYGDTFKKVYQQLSKSKCNSPLELEQFLINDIKKKSIQQNSIIIKQEKLENKSPLTRQEMIEEHEKSLSIKPSLRPIPSIEISNKQPIICHVKNKNVSSVDSVRQKINTTKDKLDKEDRLKMKKKRKRSLRNESLHIPYSDGIIRRSKRLRV